jgi:hypothetical protein
MLILMLDVDGECGPVAVSRDLDALIRRAFFAAGEHGGLARGWRGMDGHKWAGEIHGGGGVWIDGIEEIS